MNILRIAPVLITLVDITRLIDCNAIEMEPVCPEQELSQ